MLRVLLSLLVIVFAMYEFVECGCFWQGQRYAVGETWSLPDFPCVNCTCQIDDMGLPAVGCKNKPCPKPRCRKPKIDPNVCCPYCEDIPNIPPTVTDAEDHNNNEQRAGCETPRGHRKDGEVYSSNSTGIRPTSENQCVMCICQNGQQLCHLKTCIVPKTCSKFINSTDDCCPQCADVNELSLDDPAYFENRAIISSQLDEEDCLDVSGIKRNGTTWHPSIATIGQIDCITCTCLNGKIKCDGACADKPKSCKPCSEDKKKRDKIKGSKKKNRRKDRKRRKGNKHRRNRKDCKDKANKNKKRCRKRRRERCCPTTSPSPPVPIISPGIDLKNLCIKKNTKYLVYKAILDKEVFIAFDDLEGDSVEVFRWLISQGVDGSVVSYTEPEILPAPEFRRQINNTNVVGTTGKKHYKRFKRRLNAKLEKCSDSCQPELFIKILQGVKVRLLKFGEECKT